MSGREKPISKSAKALIENLKRTQGVRTLERRHLIVCEDDKSAPAYFKALIRHLGIHASSVMVVGSKGKSSPTQVVDHAIKRGDEAASPRSSTVPFGKVWCVIDGDYGRLIGPARKQARQLDREKDRRQDVKILVSTPCFEYWRLLHFEDSAKSLVDCDRAVAALKKHVPRYRKGSFDFGSIVDQAALAGSRAKKHQRSRATSALPETQNPCSELHRLIDELHPPGDESMRKS